MRDGRLEWQRLLTILLGVLRMLARRAFAETKLTNSGLRARLRGWRSMAPGVFNFLRASASAECSVWR